MEWFIWKGFTELKADARIQLGWLFDENKSYAEKRFELSTHDEKKQTKEKANKQPRTTTNKQTKNKQNTYIHTHTHTHKRKKKKSSVSITS